MILVTIECVSTASEVKDVKWHSCYGHSVGDPFCSQVKCFGLWLTSCDEPGYYVLLLLVDDLLCRVMFDACESQVGIMLA